ncbi:MAG TPA: ABC transporter permease [Anaerolineales bacterium]|nr:ABC transporter permease [Anaerolineales bacterium]
MFGHQEQKSIRTTIIEPSKNWFGANLKELWDYRDLCWMLALREVQLRYRQTILGVTWVIIQPLITTAVFTLIFGKLLNAKSDNITYALFAFVGLLPWNVFSDSLQRAGVSLTRDIRLITKIFFPRIIIPISNAISTLVDFLVSFVLMLILLLIYKMPVSINILTIPFLLLFTMILSIGVGIIFAALNVYYRDFAYVLPFVIQIWMFASPLAYSSKLIPQSLTWIYDLNPMVGIINGFRWAVFGQTDFPLNSLLYSFVVGLVVFSLGLLIFRRLERSFADVI